jgi:acetylornithine deacetylase/succinyl-diaminopimelate desuccinylase family protein
MILLGNRIKIFQGWFIMFLLDSRSQKELLDLHKKLVSIPSVNQENNGDRIPEKEIADFIAEYLRKIGMEVQILKMENGRPNVWGYWPGSENQKKKKLVLSAHMDTVDIDGMTVDPFKTVEIDGKIYGRGTCDTKGSLATFLWTLAQIAPRHESMEKDIQFLGTCDEENGCLGSVWLAKHGFTADEIIIGEPTQNHVAVTHRGAMVLDFQTSGVSTHASVPEKGDNALYQMCDLIEKLRSEWIPKHTACSHPLLGSSTAVVTVIHSGHRYNIIPDGCEATMDIRYMPEQNSQRIIQEIETIINELRQSKNVKAKLNCADDKAPLWTDPNLPFAQELLKACDTVNGNGNAAGLPFMTDASPLTQNGAKCVVFGPGNIANAHSKDEFLEIKQLYQAAEILLRFFKI